MRTKSRRRRPTPASVEKRPEIVTLAANIVSTEVAISTVVTRNVQLQMKLNDCINEESSLRKVLSGLHREMDRFTGSTRVH